MIDAKEYHIKVGKLLDSNYKVPEEEIKEEKEIDLNDILISGFIFDCIENKLSEEETVELIAGKLGLVRIVHG